jgi:hypothetical protein
MKVVVPYTKLRRMQQWLLRRYNPCYVDVSASDDDYWTLLTELWQQRETVVLIEHDILPWPGALEELVACPALWCAYSYDQHGIGIFHSFGCVKFSGELMNLLPDIWQGMDKHWSQLDQQFEWRAFQAGQRPHGHRPAVIHLHEYGAL